jgi:hypothetical protein
MYKAHSQQWGIEKKIKDEDAVKIFRAMVDRAKAGKHPVYVKGGKINPDRLQRYRNRAAAILSGNISTIKREYIISLLPKLTSSYVVGHTLFLDLLGFSSIYPRLEDPLDLKVPQECMQILGNYMAGSTEAGVWRWSGPCKPGAGGAFTWGHYLATSQGLITHNRTKEGFFVLAICFNEYKSYLQQPDPLFWLATYKAAMLLARRDRMLGDLFLHYASKLTLKVLPPNHPFNNIWSRIMITGMPGLQQHAAALLESYLQTRRYHATLIDADHTSIVQIAFVLMQLRCSGMITYALLREIIMTIMNLLPTRNSVTKYLLNEAKFRMACLSLEKRELNKAEGEIEEIVSWLDLQTDKEYIHLRIKCLWIMFEIKDRRGEHKDAVRACIYLVKLCHDAYGPVHLQTLDAISALEDLYYRANDKAAARKIARQFNKRWEVFADRARSNGGFPHTIQKPWYYRCTELEEDQEHIQEMIDLFNRRFGPNEAEEERLAEGGKSNNSEVPLNNV